MGRNGPFPLYVCSCFFRRHLVWSPPLSSREGGLYEPVSRRTCHFGCRAVRRHDPGVPAGCASGRTWPVRLLRAVPVVVAVLLGGRRGAGRRRRRWGTVRGAA